MRRSLIVLVFLAFCPLLLAQQALNNDAVVKLVKAGLSEDLIVSTVYAQAGAYDTSTDGLIALKSSGVPDKVVAAIVSKNSATAAATVRTAPVAADPDDPMSQHEAGIYASSESAGKHTLTMLEPSIYTQGKVGGVFTSAMTYGIAKAKVKAVIRDAHSNVRLTDSKAVFYFYFERQGAGLSNASSIFAGTSTPNEYCR